MSPTPAISELSMIIMTMTMTVMAMMIKIMMTMANVGFWTTTSRPGRPARNIAETGEQVGFSF